MNQTGLLALYTHNAAANHRLLDTAALLSEAELNRDSSLSHGSVRVLILHMLAAEATYLRRCQERPVDVRPEDLGALADIRQHWLRLAEEQQAYIQSAGDGGLARPLRFPLRDQTFELPRWQLLVQAFVHSTQHRGELAVMLTEMGHPLQVRDIIVQFVEASGQAWPWA